MPDLNSVPPSPRVLALSRRASSQQMPPPPAPGPGQGQGQGQGPAPSTSDPALNILPSNQNAVNTGAPTTASLPSPRLVATGSAAHPGPADASSLANGPGPTRHPQPLTAAELHQQVEKEQEAVVCSYSNPPREFGKSPLTPYPPQVNRLTRELDILRAHNDASSASASESGADSSASTIPMIPDGRQHCKQQRWCAAPFICLCCRLCPAVVAAIPTIDLWLGLRQEGLVYTGTAATLTCPT